MMQVSRNGALFIALHEALVLVAYQDPDWNHPSIGFGHNRDHRYQRGSSITIREGFALLKEDIAIRSADLNRWFRVSVSQQQFDAAMSLYYEYGTRDGGIRSLAEFVNAGDLASAEAAFLACDKDIDGSFKPGLLVRRLAEQMMFRDGNYGPIGKVTLWRDDPKTTKSEVYTVQDGDL